MAISIRHFKAFLTLADSHNFTHAARQMHITQPGLSMMIRDLEEQLRASLLDRTTRSVELTQAGRRLLPAAQRIVAEYDAVLPEVSQLSIERRTTLNVAATPMFMASVMPRVILALRLAHPSLDLHLTEATKAEVETLVSSGEADCGLGVFPARIHGLVRQPLFSFDFVYVESRSQPVAFVKGRTSRRIRWTDLPGVPFVQLAPASELQKAIDRCLRAAGRVALDRSLTFGSFESLIAMAAAGVGPTILPSFAVSSTAADIVAVPLGDPPLTMDFHMIAKRGRKQPTIIQQFNETLLSQLRPVAA